jgi:hypothetical protein
MTPRWDETWHRILEWTNNQGSSERLAAQILLQERFQSLDPSHPLGGKDGGRDAVCTRDGRTWVMAVYFPRGQQQFSAIKKKFESDVKAARAYKPDGIAFVTNQELMLAEREELKNLAAPNSLELFHLEKITTILDSPAMAAVRKQFLGIDYEDAPVISLGGQGGMAPGAGGGGGGVIGDASRGGDGGPGGRIILAGTAGKAPGAGGGGEGALGDRLKAGGGGGGGDFVSVTIDPEEFKRLRAAGFDHLEFRVGRGGEGGGPGEDTIVNLVTADRKVLKSIRAKGGDAGSLAEGPQTGRHLTASDLENGVHVSSLLLAECAHVRDGLIFVLGAGWEYYDSPTPTFQAQWPLVVTVSISNMEPETLLAFSAIVTDPTGLQVSRQNFSVSSGASRAVARPSAIVSIRFCGSSPGIWLITVVSGALTLATLPIEIRLPLGSRSQSSDRQDS